MFFYKSSQPWHVSCMSTTWYLDAMKIKGEEKKVLLNDNCMSAQHETLLV